MFRHCRVIIRQSLREYGTLYGIVYRYFQISDLLIFRSVCVIIFKFLNYK
jgi:hypothetical protein